MIRFILNVFLMAAVITVGCSSDDNGPSAPVAPVNSPPELVVDNEIAGYVDSMIVVMVTASDSDGVAPMLSVDSLPPGAEFIDSGNGTGVLTWLVTESDLGRYSVVLAAVDAADSTIIDIDTLLLTVTYPSTPVSSWDLEGAYWRTVIDATDDIEYVFFSFATRDVVGQGTLEGSGGGWDLGFRNEVIVPRDSVLFPTDGQVRVGSVAGRQLDSLMWFDTAFVNWRATEAGYGNYDWFRYYHPSVSGREYNDGQALRIEVLENVIVLVDAEGDNYVKAIVDSSDAKWGFPDMGRVWMSYVYQAEPGSRDLSGEIQEVELNVGPGAAYFDFSSGQRMYPSDPSASLEWDICITKMNMVQNSGPGRLGSTASFPMFERLADASDIGAVTEVSEDLPMFEDFAASPFIRHYTNENRNWFIFDAQGLSFMPAENVYFVESEGVRYALEIVSYVAAGGSNAKGGTYEIIWRELD